MLQKFCSFVCPDRISLGYRFCNAARISLQATPVALKARKKIARPAGADNHKPAAFLTKRPSNVRLRSTLVPFNSSSKATSMSLAERMPAAGMTPSSE